MFIEKYLKTLFTTHFFFLQLCEPVKKLPKCRFFRDMTWSLISNADNVTEQIVNCHCPRGSVAYLIKRQAFQVNSGIGYKYSFACSPQSVSIPLGKKNEVSYFEKTFRLFLKFKLMSTHRKYQISNYTPFKCGYHSKTILK